MSVTLLRLSAILFLAAPFCLRSQTAADLQTILERLDRLERENRALTDEVKALRARLDGTAAQPGPTAPPPEAAVANPPASPQSLEDQIAVQQQRIDELEQSKVEAGERFPIRLTGMALFNTFLDTRKSGGIDYPVVALPPAAGHAGATMHQTIIGLDFRGPSTFLGGNVHGNVYMDFFSGGSTNQVHLRTAEIEIDWATRSIMVGVEKPIFNPREPSSLAQVGISPLTGTGNLWLWLPQVRLEQDLKFDDNAGVRMQMGVIQTREAGPYPGSTFTGTVEPVRPGLEGRYEFYYNFDSDRRLEIAPGFHSSVTHAGGFAIPSRLWSMDWFYNPHRRIEFTGAFYSGQNVAPLGEGYQQGFGFSYREAYAVGSRGGWNQITLHTLPRLDFHLFAGMQKDNPSDLAAGRIGRNSLFGGNLYFRIAPNVLVGVETTQLRTSYLGQAVRINNHYDLALAYLF